MCGLRHALGLLQSMPAATLHIPSRRFQNAFLARNRHLFTTNLAFAHTKTRQFEGFAYFSRSPKRMSKRVVRGPDHPYAKGKKVRERCSEEQHPQPPLKTETKEQVDANTPSINVCWRLTKKQGAQKNAAVELQNRWSSNTGHPISHTRDSDFLTAPRHPRKESPHPKIGI